MTWRPPHKVDPEVGQLTELNCASVGSCRSVDVFGNVFTGHDGRWSPPRWSGVLQTLDSLTCPTRDFCAGLDEHGRWLVSQRSRWSESEPIFDNGYATQLSCTSKTFCAAVGSSYGGSDLAGTWNGVRWSAPAQIAQLPVGLSCASRDFCVVTYFLGGASVFDGTDWGPRDPLEGLEDDLFSISCPVDGFCVAASRVEGIVYHRGGWGVPTRLTEAGGVIRAVACAVDRECFALETSGLVHPYRHRDWQPAERIGPKGFADIDCPATDSCLALKSGSQLYAYDGASWRPSGDTVEYTHGVNGVSCPCGPSAWGSTPPVRPCASTDPRGAGRPRSTACGG